MANARSLEYWELAVLCSAALVNRVAHSPVCNWMFACGCRSLWQGGWSSCNVHSHSNHRCPWCLPWLSPVTAGWFHLWRLDSSFDQAAKPAPALRHCDSQGAPSARPRARWAYLLMELSVGFVYALLFAYPDFVLYRPPLCQEGAKAGRPRCRTPLAPAPTVPLGDSSGLDLIPSVLLGSLGATLWAVAIRRASLRLCALAGWHVPEAPPRQAVQAAESAPPRVPSLALPQRLGQPRRRSPHGAARCSCCSQDGCPGSAGPSTPGEQEGCANLELLQLQLDR